MLLSREPGPGPLCLHTPGLSKNTPMILAEKQRELDLLLQQASELLGGPACAVSLESEMEAHVRRTARRDLVAGLDGAPPIRSFLRGSPGSQVVYGLERFQLRIAGELVPIVKVSNPFCDDCCDPLADMWAVRAATYRTVYRHLRRSTQGPRQNVPPVMDPADRDRLWANTIGFLLRGEEALERFGVTLKRGVLLVGEPGNGKTMASRWLLAQAWRHNFEWRTVRPEQYESARAGSSAHYLFELDRPGIILFDDLDQALGHRDSSGPSLDASTFLSELDGLEIRRGVVYLFTSTRNSRTSTPPSAAPGASIR